MSRSTAHHRVFPFSCFFILWALRFLTFFWVPVFVESFPCMRDEHGLRKRSQTPSFCERQWTPVWGQGSRAKVFSGHEVGLNPQAWPCGMPRSTKHVQKWCGAFLGRIFWDHGKVCRNPIPVGDLGGPWQGRTSVGRGLRGTSVSGYLSTHLS